MLVFKKQEKDLQMSSKEIAIEVCNLGKRYEIYDNPNDRLKQFLYSGLKKFKIKNKKCFRDFWALRDISFEVKKGEIIGIIGRNGSGKSTLLQIICGTLSPTNGTVQINGKIAALLELGSGFNPEFTGRENVYLNASVLGLSNAQIDQRFNDISTFADIGQFIDQPIKTYSSGMMVRLAFSVIAHVDADILVIDEALAVGDAFFTQKCMRYLRNYMKTGTVFFVSHDTSSIKNLCNRALWLDKGQILQVGLPKDICNSYLKAYYEEQQGTSFYVQTFTDQLINHNVAFRDQRLEFINKSNLRNDLEIFRFNHEADSFGKGGAQILNVHLMDENNQTLSWVVGGERVILSVYSITHQELNSPIIGFYIKDRLGQTLFGDNTYLTYMDSPNFINAETRFTASFSFNMPLLPSGDYSITVALANGNQELHVQHHWIHDAIIFKSHSTSVSTGIIGIPMLDITLKKLG
jgi:lipopolysaccharide transport system ATP-binding protein